MSIAEKLTTIAENQERVFEAGKKSQYDEFWDSFQQNGNRTAYDNGFSGICWNSENFKPKYKPMRVVNGVSMFLSFDAQCKKTPVVIDETIIDFTNTTNVTSMFQNTNASVVKMNVIPTKLTSMKSFINMNNIVTHGVTEVILGIHEAVTFNTYSFWTGALEKVSFLEGSVIGNNIWFSYCKKLTHESLINILNTLQEKSSGTFTCTLGADNLAKLTDAEKSIATEKGWTLA